MTLQNLISPRFTSIIFRSKSNRIAIAGLRFEKSLIRQLLSEDIMQESVIYQDILQKGEQKGEQKEAFRFLNRKLNRKFGAVDSSIINRIQVLSTEELEILGEEFLGFSDVSDLLAWLDRADIR